jgi:ribosome-binding factor A
MARRTEKVNELMRDVLSEIIQREVHDPRIGFLSVTDVKVAPDLSSARVFISVMGDEDQQKDSMTALQRAKGFIRTELARRIRTLRHTPDLIFKLDDSIKTGIRVHELLDNVKREDAARLAHSTEDTDTTEEIEEKAESSTGGDAD